MPNYPKGVQNRGESPYDKRIVVGGTITITEYSPDGAGSSNHSYKILGIVGDTATIQSVSKPGEPVKASLAYLKERLVD